MKAREGFDELLLDAIDGCARQRHALFLADDCDIRFLRQRVDALGSQVECAFELRFLTDVQFEKLGVDQRLRERAAGLDLDVADVGEIAVGVEQARSGRADPAGAAGDESNLIHLDTRWC